MENLRTDRHIDNHTDRQTFVLYTKAVDDTKPCHSPSPLYFNMYAYLCMYYMYVWIYELYVCV
ncbi:hypothetical protein V3C99_012374 [Haemonchus contortus]